METLTEKAKKAPTRSIHKITPELIEMAVAWAKEEITIGQIKHAIKVSEPNKIYSVLARALKEKVKADLQKLSLDQPTINTEGNKRDEDGKNENQISIFNEINKKKEIPIEDKIRNSLEKFQEEHTNNEKAPSKY